MVLIDVRTTSSTTRQLKKKLVRRYEPPAPKYAATSGTNITTLPSDRIQSSAVEYMEGRLVFDPAAMDPGRPYLFRFLEHWMAVKKTPANDLEFFYFSKDDPEQ
jgi:hypothetical protein